MNNKIKSKISIITVCYNSVDIIEKTILSIINQTYPNIEYIIIDGKSSDGTIDIIKKYENKISYWISEPDLGIYDAMNKGIVQATGDWIGFINSGDNLLQEDVIYRMIELYDNQSDIIYGDTQNYISKVGLTFIQKPYPLDMMESRMVFGHPSSLVRSSILKHILFDTTYRSSADYNFFLHCYKDKKKFQYIPITIAVFDYDTGISSNFKINRYEKARVQGTELTITWKLKYYLEYSSWSIRYWVKKYLPEKLIKKYYIRRIKIIQQKQL